MSMMEHSPLPWRLYGLNDIQDANGNPCASGWNPDTDFTEDGQALAKADAEFIVRAVNDRNTLLKLVRRFRDMCNHLPPLLTGVALVEAEVEGGKKMEKPAVISEGYKRIAELMGAAYLALGEEPESALGEAQP